MTFQSMLPNNATSAELAIEQAYAEALDIGVPLEQINNPETCPLELLPWLAWALSVDYWRTEWPEQTKRAVVKSAYETHRKKGTPQSLRKAIEALGTRLHITEWFEYDGEPGTVRIDAYINEVLAEDQEIISQELLVDLLLIIENQAPARVQFELNVGADFKGQLTQAGILPTAATVVSSLGNTVPQREHHYPLTFNNANMLQRPVVLASFAGATV